MRLGFVDYIDSYFNILYPFNNKQILFDHMDIFEVKPVEILKKRPKWSPNVDGYHGGHPTGHRLLFLNMSVGDPMFRFELIASYD